MRRWFLKNIKTKKVGSPILGFLLFLLLIPQAYTQNLFYHLLPHAIAPFTWVGLGADANWTTAQNWSSGVVPGASNTAIFDENCSINCSPTINANISVGGVLIKNTYAGTITQGSGNTVTIGSAGWTQSTGTFVGGNSQVTFTDSALTLSGTASYTATTGTTYFNSTTAHGTFDVITLAATNTLTFPNSSTARFSMPSSCSSPTYRIASPIKVSFYNLTTDSSATGCGPLANFGSATATIEVRNNYSFTTTTDSLAYLGTFEVYGNISSLAPSASNSTSSWYLMGAVSTTYEGPGGVDHLFISKTGGATVTPKAGTVLFKIGGLSVLTGSFTMPTTLNIAKNNTAIPEWFKIASGATVVTPANSTVNLTAWGSCSNPSYSIDVDTTYSFENLTITSTANGCGYPTLTKAAGDTIIVTKNFTPNQQVNINHNFVLEGNLLAGTGNPVGNMGITFQNTSAESASMNTAFTTGNWNVNKTSGTVTLQTNTVLTAAGQDLDITSGILNMNGKNLTINDTLTIAANGKLLCNGGTVSAGTYVLVGEFSCGTTIGITWTGAAGDHLWTTAGNWTNNNVPGINDLAVFNGKCTGVNCNVTINANVDVKGIKIYSTYPGTISQGSYNVNMRASGYDQNGGTFTGGSGTISTDGTFSFSAGTFTSTSSTLTIFGNIAITTPGTTFNPNSGTVALSLNQNSVATVSTGTTAFNNFSLIGHGYSATRTITGNVYVDGLYTCGPVSGVPNIASGTISARGDVSYSGYGCNGTTINEIVGTTNQTVTGIATANIPNFVINSTGGTVSLVGNLLFYQDFTYIAGTVNAGTSNVIFPFKSWVNNTITATPSLQLYNITFNGNGYGANKTIAGTLVSTGTFTCDSTNDSGPISSGTILVKGNAVFSNLGCQGSTLVKIGGSTNQTVTGSVNASVPIFEINSTGGTVSLASTLNFTSNFTYTSGTVNSGTSTAVFLFGSWKAATITSTPAMVFANVTFIGNGYGDTHTIAGTVVVGSDFLCDSTSSTGNLSGGKISVLGNATFADNGCVGSTLVEIVGSGNQTVSGVNTANILPFKINSTGGIVTLSGYLSFTYDFTYVSGTIDAGTSTVQFVFGGSRTVTYTSNTSLVFNNVKFEGYAYNAVDNIVGTIVVNGLLTINSTSNLGLINSGTIQAKGDVTFLTNGADGTTLIEIAGSTNQTITGTSTALIQSFKVNSTGGTVTFAGSLRFYRDLIYTAGNFNGGTSNAILEFHPGYSPNNITWTTAQPFNDLTIQGDGWASTKTLSSNIQVNGTLTCATSSTRGSINSNTIYARGNIAFSNLGCGGTTSIVAEGTSSTTISQSSTTATPTTQPLTVNKTGGASVLFASDITFSAGQNLNISGGTLNLSGYLMTVVSTTTVSAGATLFCNGGDFTSGSVTNSGTINCPGYGPYTFHWTGAGGDTNWNTATNWSGGVVPGVNDLPAFSNSYCGSTCNATINVSTNVRGIRFLSGYTGTVTQATGSSVTLGAQGWKQLSGTFTGSDSAITDNGNFIFSGGTLNAPSNTISVAGTYTVSGTAAFNAGTSTLSLAGSAGVFGATTTITPGTVTYKHLVFAGPVACNGFDLNAGTFTVSGNLTLSSSGWCTGNPRPLNNGTINVGGNVTVTDKGYTGNAVVNLTGNASGQTVTGINTGTLPALKFTTGTNPVTLSGWVRVSSNFTVTSVGTFTATGSTLEFIGDSSVTPGTITYNDVAFPFVQACTGLNFNGGNMKVGGNLTMDGTGWCGGLRPLNNGTVSVNGNISVANQGYNGTAVVAAVGNAGGQTITGVSTANIPNLTINVGANPINLSGSVLVNNATVVTTGALNMAGADLKTTSLALNGNTITKNAGTLIVNGTTVGTGSLYGGTVAP